MKSTFVSLVSRQSRSGVALLCLFSITGLHAQNTSTASGSWNDGVWSEGYVPDRTDGTLSTSQSTGESVEISGANTIDISGSSNHASGTLGYTGVNSSPVASASTGYVDTSSHLFIDNGGTLNIGGQVQVDVGMAHGGAFLPGVGTVETSAGTGSGTRDDSHLDATTYNGAVDSQYRDVSYWLRNDAIDNQLYIPDDVYDPVHSAAGTGGSSVDLFPLHQAGGYMQIGNTTGTGTVNMDGGILNVVQYGWNWGADDINGVTYTAGSSSSYNGNTDTWTAATDATVGDSRFEGYEIDYDTGGYVTGSSNTDTTKNAEGGAAAVFVDASELDNTYYHSGDANDSGSTHRYTDVGTGNGTYQFTDPPTGSTSFSNSSSTGPYGAEGAIPVGDPTFGGADGAAPVVDYYHTIGRSGGDIRVGAGGDAIGVFNVSDGIVTTNNLQVGLGGDAKGTVNQVGGDVYTRETLNIGASTLLQNDTGTDGVYNFGNNATNGMDGATVFDNSLGDGEDPGGDNGIDGDAQYFGRTSTGFEYGDGVGGDAASSLSYAPNADGGGALEVASTVYVGTRGQGALNINAATTFDWTDPDTQVSATRDSAIAIGGSIQLGIQGGDQDAYSVVNFDSPVDLVATGRTTNNIIIAMGRNTGNNPQTNQSLGIFNYNPTAGQIGSLNSDNFNVDDNANNGGGRNEWDQIVVGRGEGATGYFNHNSAKTIYADSSIIVGDWRQANGTFNLLGQADAAAYNAATGAVEGDERFLDAADNDKGGIEADDGLFVGNSGYGVFNQTGQTDVALIRQAADRTSGGAVIRDLHIGYRDEHSSSGRSNGTATPIERDQSYGEYNFGLPDVGDGLVHSGSAEIGASRADEGSNNLGTINTPTISEILNLQVGTQGDGVFNYYADTDNLNIDNNINLGSERTGVGAFNIVSDDGVQVNSGTVGTGANADINIGESGTGIFSQGTFINDHALGECEADGTTGQNSLVNTNGGDLVVGGARNYAVQRGHQSLYVDSGDGTYNLNGDGADLDIGGGRLTDTAHTSSGRIEIGTGENIQEGIMFLDNVAGGSNLADVTSFNVTIDDPADTDPSDGTDTIEVTRTVVNDARNPWGNTLDDHGTGAWLRESGEDADDNQLGTGTIFGTASTFGTDEAVTNANGEAVTQNYFAGGEDGQGAIGKFNHNNDVDLYFNQADITIADGDNSIGAFNQNGTGDVIMQGALEMSVDRFSTGNATLDAPDVAALAAATAGSDATQFEMGQSTYSVNNVDAVFDLQNNNITGDSVDVAGGSGAAVTDTYSGSGLVKGNLQNRANEAQINLYNGRIQNTNSTITADVVQFGGVIEISDNDTGAAGAGGLAQTMTLDQNHDFIQVRSGATITTPDKEGISTTTSLGGAIEFTMVEANVNFANTVDDPVTGPDPISYIDPEQWNATSTAASTVGGLIAANTGSEVDTIVADHIDFSYETASIILNFDENADSALAFEAGMYWDLADFVDFETTDYTDHASMDVFAYRDASGAIVGDISTLLDGKTGANGRALRWSVDSADTTSANAAPDIWDTHGIIYIYEEGQILPEPSSALLVALGGLTLIGRRKRKS